jgi:hypothetical protein
LLLAAFGEERFRPDFSDIPVDRSRSGRKDQARTAFFQNVFRSNCSTPKLTWLEWAIRPSLFLFAKPGNPFPRCLRVQLLDSGHYFWSPGLFSMPKHGFQIVKNHFQKMPGLFLPVQTLPNVFTDPSYKCSNDSECYKITLCYAATSYAYLKEAA